MKKTLLRLAFIITLFTGCKKDQSVTTDISVTTSEKVIYWNDYNELTAKIDSSVTFNYGNANEEAITKSYNYNSDTSQLEVSINLKVNFRDKFEDPNKDNNMVTIGLVKETNFIEPDYSNAYTASEICQMIQTLNANLPNFDLANQTTRCIPLTFHISSATSYTNNDLSTVINNLNNYFADAKITFSASSVISLNYNSININNFTQANDVPNTVNIYVVNSILENTFGYFSGIQGKATFPIESEKRVYIRPKYLKPQDEAEVLAHELGHLFSLFHTFQTGFYQNLVCNINSVYCNNGMGFENTGDGICETPFDAFSSPNNTNVYSEFCNGVNDKNLMTYSFGYLINNCDYEFTISQSKRIRFAANHWYSNLNCYNNPNPTSEISLTGNLNFGDVQINTNSNPRTLTVANTGNAPFSITNISLPSGYSITQGPYQPISPNNSISLTVVFNPTNTQTYNGNITVHSTANNGNNTIAVSGTGTNAGSNNSVISLNGNLNFGTVDIGNSGTQSFTISNNGNTSFSVNSITSSNSAFSFSGWTSGVINANGSKTVNVTFTPTNAQSYNSTITVNSTADNNAGNNTISASGVGQTIVTTQPNLIYSAHQIDDDNSTSSGNDNGIAEAGEIIELDVEIENIGNGDANNVDVILSTTDPDINITDDDRFYGTISAGTSDWSPDFDFEIDANCPTKNVTFTLQISSDEGNWTRTFTVPIQGSSGGTPISITPSNSCTSAPIMQVNTDYTVSINTANYTLSAPINGQGFGGNDVRGFWIKFQEPIGFVGDIDIEITNVSSNFDPVIGHKFSCSGIYYTQWNQSTYVANSNSYGGNETFNDYSNNNGYTHYIRIYHYYGSQTPNISFDIRISN